MTTMRDVVTAAYRKVNVGRSGADLVAANAAEGLFALNAMLHAWKLQGVDISHSDLTLSSDFPLGDEYVEGTLYLLAGRIAPNYERPVGFDADAWFRAIQAAYATVPTLTVPSALVRPPSREDREGNLPLVES